MDNVFFDNPPVLQGSEQVQLQQLSGYLYTLSSKLNEALMAASVQEEKETKELQRAGKQAEAQQRSAEYTTLKGMIVKTAEIVRTEMDELQTTLHAETIAISEDLGTLETELEQRIRATAEGVLQDFEQSQTVTDIRTNTQYRETTSHYIYSGILDQTTGTVGIAIGDGVTAKDAQGNTVLVDEAKVATFTADRMSFWKGTTEVAYFSSGKFYITNGEITNNLQIGNFLWRAMADKSMTLVRV